VPRLWMYQSRDQPLNKPPAPPVLTPMGWEAVAQDRAPARDRAADPGAVDYPLFGPPGAVGPPAPPPGWEAVAPTRAIPAKPAAGVVTVSWDAQAAHPPGAAYAQPLDSFPTSSRPKTAPASWIDLNFSLPAAGAAPGWEGIWYPDGPRKKPTDAGHYDFPLKQAPPSPFYVVTGFEATGPDRAVRRNAGEGGEFHPNYPPFAATVQNPLGWQAHPEQPANAMRRRPTDAGASDAPLPLASMPFGWDGRYIDQVKRRAAGDGFADWLYRSPTAGETKRGWDVPLVDARRAGKAPGGFSGDPLAAPPPPPSPFGWEAVGPFPAKAKARSDAGAADLSIRAVLGVSGWEAVAADRSARRPPAAGDVGPPIPPPQPVLTLPAGWDAVVPAGAKVRRIDGGAVDAPTVRAAAAAWGWSADVPLTVRARRPADGPGVELIVGPLLPWGWQTESPASAALHRAAQGATDVQTAGPPAPVVNLEVFPTGPVHHAGARG
jgi:hypothetical protein